MKFLFSRLTWDSIDVDFDKIYSQQNKKLPREFIDDDAIYYLIDDLSENIVYYLDRIGINDLLDSENEDTFNEVCKEYEKWLKDNFDISDFK